MKIFDAFLFNDEWDLLELRFRYLWNHVDHFVIVEGDRDFAGRPKPSSETRLRATFDQYWSKIQYVGINLLENPINRWENETIQRNGLGSCLDQMDRNDILLMSDADEIPHRQAISALRGGAHTPTALVIRNHYYYLNVRDYGHGHDVYMPKVIACRAFELNCIRTPQNWQNNRLHLTTLGPEGWHFSYLGGPEAIAKKLSQFSHSEFDTDYHRSVERLTGIIDRNEDLFGRPEHTFMRIPIDSTFPEPLQEDPERWAQYIKS